MSILVSIEKLLSGKFVEGSRMEFKQGWNPKTILRSLCAFANDFENEGSGYIILGVDEDNGKAIRPVKGFDSSKFDKVQKELLGLCNLIEPSYVPRLSLEKIDKKHVLVIWAPSGNNRPYKVPDDVLAKNKKYNYRIRQFSSTVVPNTDQEMELIQLTAKLPFDDRVNTLRSINELSFGLMREHLSKTDSKLFDESASMSKAELANHMNLCQGANEHLFPKNIGLLMFSEEPTVFFKGAKIEVVVFPEGLSGKNFEEQFFTGPIQNQLLNVLSFFKNQVIKSKVIKYEGKAESDTIFNYPYLAIEEALSNAVYHRNYELLEPIEIRVLPTSIEIISYNGVDPSLRQADFDKGVIRKRRYRNRRIGEFLKELGLTEGRGTGIPTMQNVLNLNGSPAAIFDTDEPNRSSLVVEIQIHSEFLGTENNTPGLDSLLDNSGSLIGSLINQLSSRQKQILRLISKNNSFSKRLLSDVFNISSTAIQLDLSKLLDLSMIERIGGTRGTWQISLSNKDLIQLDSLLDSSSSLIGSLINNFSDRQTQILTLLKANKKLTKPGLANQLNVSPSIIQKELNILKQLGLITRQGGTRGHWKVNNMIKN